MAKKIDSNTGFYIDIDLKTGKVIGWNYGQRQKLEQKIARPESSPNFCYRRPIQQIE